MAGQFCMQCGKPLTPGTQFCMSCGAPIRGAAPSEAPGAIPPPPPPPPPPPGPSLGSVLGVEGGRNFLLQHQLMSNGRNYRVLNSEKRHLFTVRESFGQEVRANFLGGSGMSRPAFGLGALAMGTRSFVWEVLDAAGTPRGRISIQVSRGNAVSTLADLAGTPLLAINVDKGLVGGLAATAATVDGRPMFQAHGNLIHHNFSIQDPAGQEVAKVHEAWASVRDTYNVDLTGNVDPLGPLIFAILIDREKETN
jgi:hypothetical protein